MVNLNKQFTGKTLLLLGTNPGTCDMVNYARSRGARVIVTDNQPTERSAGKQIADEAWLVSSADVDTLERLATKHKVSGVLAGASDFNVERALTLCERIGLPFYCNRGQWDICSNKQRFKRLCRDNGVPVARTYSLDRDSRAEDLRLIKYPVIVKPVDRSGGTGISICRKESELLKAYPKALSLSRANRAIVEEFVEGDEVNAGYTIKNGEFSLSCTVDRYFYQKASDTIPLPQSNILPSKYTGRYIRELNNKVVQMFQSIGLTNGFIFVQSVINDEGFHMLEANYRLPGSSWERFISGVNGINYLEMLVNHALTGKMDGYDLSLDNPNLNKFGWCCIWYPRGRGRKDNWFGRNYE